MPTGQDSVFNSEAINSQIENLKSLRSEAPMQPMTFGEKLVGLTFNPSNDDKVSKAKRLCAELMDLVNEARHDREQTELESYLYPHTIGEILNAQMNVVKVLTLKY